jgi:hypothetical protein
MAVYLAAWNRRHHEKLTVNENIKKERNEGRKKGNGRQRGTEKWRKNGEKVKSNDFHCP